MYVNGAGTGTRQCIALSITAGLSLSGRIYFRHFTYRSPTVSSGAGHVVQPELFRNVPLIVQFFTQCTVVP